MSGRLLPGEPIQEGWTLRPGDCFASARGTWLSAHTLQLVGKKVASGPDTYWVRPPPLTQGAKVLLSYLIVYNAHLEDPDVSKEDPAKTAEGASTEAPQAAQGAVIDEAPKVASAWWKVRWKAGHHTGVVVRAELAKELIAPGFLDHQKHGLYHVTPRGLQYRLAVLVN